MPAIEFVTFFGIFGNFAGSLVGTESFFGLIRIGCLGCVSSVACFGLRVGSLGCVVSVACVCCCTTLS